MEVTPTIEDNVITAEGGPGKPAPPKGYVPLSVQQRTDWNGFLDYLKGQGNINLNDAQVGNNFLNQYKLNNPSFSITPDQIPFIQYEQQQLRKGDAFGGLDADQLKQLRAGMSPNYLNAVVPDPNGQFTPETAKLYYPQFKVGARDFGTNIEDYIKMKGGKVPDTTGQSGTSQHVQPPPAVSQPVMQNNTSSVTAPPGTIPRPNYSDPQSRFNYLKKLGTKYGDFLHGRGDTPLHVNDIPDTDNQSVRDSSIQAAKPLGLDPALLYASSMEEGMSGLFPDKNGQVTSGEAATEEYPVDGFYNFGIDHFHDNFKEMVRRGYLPKDFDYQKARQKNPENGEIVNSGNFKTAADAIKAKAAYVKMFQDDTEKWAQQKGITLSPKAKEFFTLIAFNGGPGTYHKLVNYYNSKGLLKDDKYLEVKPDKSVDPGGAWGHVIPRIKMANLLKQEGYF